MADTLDSVHDVVQALVARDAPLAAGTIVGADYRIEGRLGRGGMGVVYLARDLRLDRWVAIKVHRGAAADGAERLAREATALARVSHCNVVAIHRIGEHDGRPFVVMEHVDGGTLRGWLAGGGRAWRDVVGMFVAAGAGLAAAHRAGLVHRDFKPDNVLLGSDGRPRLADFGLARAIAAPPACVLVEDDHGGADTVAAATTTVGHRPGPLLRPAPVAAVVIETPRSWRTPPTGPNVTFTVTGARIGTPAYMAPEQYDGRPVDARADQYAFGVALWEALFGERPFDDDGHPRAPSRPVPDGAVVALRRGLALAPADRFAALDDLLAVLAAEVTNAGGCASGS